MRDGKIAVFRRKKKKFHALITVRETALLDKLYHAQTLYKVSVFIYLSGYIVHKIKNYQCRSCDKHF